ncbi:hypothetical protein Gbth_062_090 [Gluconobacter thailandicus F149-1 = NBRC 100600]|nr:hypothetical protein Gbth_062_090 [Gluconobacter thailandicus F149-1 = NBRC 100600]GEL87359.1 hypothetical protein GTH01_17170 [Gluconobacter thailandicus F149-1 = NBRC 100600]
MISSIVGCATVDLSFRKRNVLRISKSLVSEKLPFIILNRDHPSEISEGDAQNKLCKSFTVVGAENKLSGLSTL